MTNSTNRTAIRPIVRLRPKMSPRAVRHGAPWVYADELVFDRRTRAIKPGSIVDLQDGERRPLATAAFNPKSKIAVRILDRSPEAVIDTNWLHARLSHALDLREALYDEPFYRLIHAEADGLPGVVIDRFGDCAVIQPNAAWAEVLLEDLSAALVEVAGVKTVVINGAGRARALEGLDDAITVLRGSVTGPIEVPMNGATYMADLLGGQKTGLFFDQRSNHAFAAKLANGRSVLDVFAHVGGFSLGALANGAASALAVDSSAPALELAAAGAKASGFAKNFNTLKADAFDALSTLQAQGNHFGVVVCDPPAFAPHKSALEAGLRAYERLARLGSALVDRGGFLVLCSCSHAASLPRFREACMRGIGKAGRQAQIIHTGTAGPDHPTHPYLAESAYLKALFLRLN